jgi:glycosyltransferase involved in cell wall biosynthesis
MKTLVMMPTFNEVETLRHTVEKLVQQNLGVDIVIIDDNSPDGTGALADRLKSEYQCVDVIHRSKKEGLGRAYAAGFKFGLERNYSRLVEMDADGSHRPEDLASLLLATKSADLVIGSRWTAGGEVANWSFLRQLISRLGNQYASLMLKSKIRDLTSGYRIYSASLAKQLPIEKMQSHGYAFQVEMAFRSQLLGAAIVEIPIRFVEREGGRSKMTLAIVLEAFLLCTKWGIFSPKR